MAESLNEISLSASNYESSQGCMFCEQDNLNFPLMICTALQEKHTNTPEAMQSKAISDIVEDRLCQPTVRYLQMIYLSEDEEMLKREYLANEYHRKITALGEYYKFHRDIPRIHAMPVERTLARHYDKRREFEYKQVKRLLKEEENVSVGGSIDSQSHHSSYVKKSKYSTLLADVKKSFEREEAKNLLDGLVEKSQSVALFEVYDKLSEIVKGIPEMPELACSYLQNSGVRNFETWVRKNIPRKHKEETAPSSAFTKKKPDFSSGSKKKLVFKYSNPNSSYNTLNMDYKKILEAKHNTLNPQPHPTVIKTNMKPLWKMSQYIGSIPLKNIDKERSIQKIYGVNAEAKPVKIYQRIPTTEKKYQDSTNVSSHRLQAGRSKSMERVVLERPIERIQMTTRTETKQQRPPIRSLSRNDISRKTRPPSREEDAATLTRGRKSMSVPCVRNPTNLRISKPRAIDGRKNSIDSQKRHTQKNVNQIELVDIMIQKKTKVDPGTIYKKLRNIT